MQELGLDIYIPSDDKETAKPAIIWVRGEGYTKGDILFIYPKEDTMWPSKVSVNYMMERLRKKHFTYQVQSIEYERASHILVPLNPSKLKMFKVERRYSDDCKKNRQEAFEKSVKWIDEH